MLNKIESEKGYVFATKDKSEVYDTIIYLGKYDSADNYIQITTEEAERIRAEQQKDIDFYEEVSINN